MPVPPTPAPPPPHQVRRAAILLALPLALACSGGGAARRAGGTASADSARKDIRIIVVTHGQSSDPFWSVVANGVRDAARDLGVRAEYQAPPRFDMVAMSQLIDAAVASRPSALVVSIPDPTALSRSIRAAVATGIPVVSINSGGDVYRGLGVLLHVGQSERQAGELAGERLAAAGAKHVLCVNHEVGNAALDRRCDGLKQALAAAGGTTRVLAVDLADPADTQQRIAGALAADPSIDAILTLSVTAAEPSLAALRRGGAGTAPAGSGGAAPQAGATDSAGAAASVRLATFDLSPRVLEAIRDGRMLFAVDQQQYLQGYLPVVLLTKYLETGALPGAGGIIPTGPGFVTRADAARVIDLSRRGLR